MFCHYVLISFIPNTDEVERDKVVKLLSELGKKTEKEYNLLFWSIERNLDKRPRNIIGGRTVDVIEIAIFKDEESFRKWRFSPDHSKVAEEMGKVMDWVIGDVIEPKNLLLS